MNTVYYELNKLLWPSKIDSDATYHLFYDETNNWRKFWLRDSDGNFNADYNKDFVLGGVAYEGERPKVSLENLKKWLGLQDNVTELKFKTQFSKKSFSECIAQRRLKLLLKWLDDSGMYIHFIRVNHLYYTIVEIFDSITNPKEIAENGFDYLKAKSVLFGVMRNHVAELQRIMYKYHYPNIDRSNIRGFGEGLLKLFPPRFDQSVYEKFISGCLKRAIDSNEMTFLMENEDYVMQENFAEFYDARISSYPYSTHMLDEEKAVEPLMKEEKVAYDNASCNYKFINSKTDVMVQVSDVIVGVLGKLFEFTNTHTKAELNSTYKNMNEPQKTCIKLLYQLFKKSDERDHGLILSVAAINEISKVEDFLALASLAI